MPSPTLLSADELLHMSFPDKRVELVRGTLVVSELPGFLHGECMVRLVRILGDYVASHDLGRVVAGDSGFKLASDPDTVRGPDVSARVYRADGSEIVVDTAGVLDGEDVVPGFACPLSTIV